MRNHILITFYFLLFALQLSVSFREGKSYPLNPYRMFSKNWNEGQKLLEFLVVDSGGNERPAWMFFDIPFFQANRLLALAFFFQDHRESQEIICELILQKLQQESVNLKQVSAVYRKNSIGAMFRITEGSQVHHECKKKTLGSWATISSIRTH